MTERFGDSLTEEGNRWVGYIGTAANRMSELIRELLDYSKIDTCARELAPVDLNEVVAQAITNLERELESTGAAIELSQLPTVEGSRLQLERLFQNLLANATKYRSEEAPRIVVGCSDDGRAYRVTVQDNGIGIKPEYQDRIFEIFRRVDSKTCHPGAGIGLAVCRKVVDSHGGEMGVDSTPGEGSTFWFTIPHSRLIPGVLSASREQAARAPVGS